jgi:AICAR transformylase/IMP cyclohydrolase PurH
MTPQRVVEIQHYLALLADEAQYHEHINEQRPSESNRARYDEALMAQVQYYTERAITRIEINQLKKKNVRSFTNVKDAMASWSAALPGSSQ